MPLPHPRRSIRLPALLLLPLLLAGCATTADRDPRDPLESYNRAAYTFNDTLDRWVLKPVARGYNTVTPEPVNQGISNVFGNLGDAGTLLNNTFQLKFDRAVSDLGRITFNTTLGVFGIFDVASHMGFEKHDEDFGQTLGYWGMPAGPYFVVPFYGPSTVRDTSALTVDYTTSPYGYLPVTFEDSLGLGAVDVIDGRAAMLGTTTLLDDASLDPYAFQRDAFLQHRRNLVHDGNPPPEEEEMDFLDDLEGIGQ
ncbi:MAG: MlaA family lipoprotein [Pseudomonadota bacterium]